MIETNITNLEINELTEEQYKSAKESGTLNSDAFYMTPSSESLITPISQGGTNAQTAQEARTNLGFEYGTENPTHIPTTGDGAIYFKIDNEDDGILPIEEGGTGAITVEGVHANLGIADYVVEQGTSGIWTYEKWNSGRCELCGRIEGSTKNVGSNFTYVEFPFYFQSTDYSVQITPSHNGSIVSKYGDYAEGGNTEHGNGYLKFYYELTSSYHPIFNFKIEGKWK